MTVAHTLLARTNILIAGVGVGKEIVSKIELLSALNYSALCEQVVSLTC